MRRMLLILVLAAGCGDNKAAGDVDAGAVPDAPIVTVTPDASTATMVARGDYLMNHVVACGDCHTPRNADGTADLTRQLAGVDCFVDSDPADDTMGCLSTKNLTNDPTGLANYSDQQIRDMFQKGMLPGGQFLNPFMPYYVFANMTDDDANSIVAYLRTVPGVNHEVMAQQPPWNNVTMPAFPAIDPMLIPQGARVRAMPAPPMAAICRACRACASSATPPTRRPARRCQSTCRVRSRAARTSSPASCRRRSRRISIQRISRPIRPASPTTPRRTS